MEAAEPPPPSCSVAAVRAAGTWQEPPQARCGVAFTFVTPDCLRSRLACRGAASYGRFNFWQMTCQADSILSRITSSIAVPKVEPTVVASGLARLVVLEVHAVLFAVDE